jgi:hypothetical protein
MTLLRDTLDGWAMAAGWPVRRRWRFRLGLLLFALGLRQLAVQAAGIRPEGNRADTSR